MMARLPSKSTRRHGGSMLRRLACFSLILLSSFAISETTSRKTQISEPQTSSDHLPVKRVVLYKNGVGYFEHVGRVRGSQDLTIDFTTDQLNDVLKSLTVIDTGEGHITGVRYNSIAPVSERLKGLRVPFGEDISRADFLKALRGTRVEVRAGSVSANGKLLSVETRHKQTDRGADIGEVTEFAIVTDSGELRSFELLPSTTVRIAEKGLSEDVNRYLSLIGSSRTQELRRMVVSTTGTGERDLFVSYISEVPVWKSTYRIIIPSDHNANALLQGWAIVDNTVGEDWKDIQLSLVAGAPQSFVQAISQPYYARRPEIPLPEAAMLTPQTHEATLKNYSINAANSATQSATSLQGTVTDPSGALVPNARVTVRNEETGVSQSTTTDQNGHYSFYGIPSGNSALFIQANGFQQQTMSNIYLGTNRLNEIHATLRVGSATETVEVTGRATQVQTESAALSEISPEAEARATGDLFSYDLKQKISIGKDQSALVPILQSHIDAEKVDLWNADSAGVLRALWVTNSSNLTLDSGTFNIVEGDTFAGEGLISILKPGERRLLSYAADPSVHIKIEHGSGQKREDDNNDDDEDASVDTVTHLRIFHGTMILTRQQQRINTYVIRNADTAPKDIVIEHPAGSGWKLADGLKPEESTASFSRFRVKVAAAATEKLTVRELRPAENTYALTDLNTNYLELFSGRQPNPEVQAALHQVLDQKNKISDLDVQINTRQQEINSITTDQGRVRENMKALRGSAEEKVLLQRYAQQLNSQEDRISALNGQITELNQKRNNERVSLDTTIKQINLDQTF
jgi:hypothetical protein